ANAGGTDRALPNLLNPLTRVVLTEPSLTVVLRTRSANLRVNIAGRPRIGPHRNQGKTAMIALRKHRFAFIFMSLSTVFAALAPLFLIAGCRTLQQTPPELKARETLRTMTRGGVLPAEDAVARIESDFPRTTAGAPARMVPAGL